MPAKQFSNCHFDGASVLGRSADQLAERLADRTFSDRVRIIEEFLLPLALKVSAADAISRAAQYQFVKQGRSRIPELAGHCGLGVRQFERTFQRGFGIAPKVFARVARFQTALDAKIAQPGLTWLDIAHRLRYHDQMHLIRDFKNLGGGAPGLLLTQIVDGRPPALAAEDVREFSL